MNGAASKSGDPNIILRTIMLVRIFAAILLVATTIAPALAARPNYNYIGAGYARQHLDLDCEQDGLFLEASFTLNELIYFHGSHTDLTSSSWCGSTSTALSLGVRADIGRQSSLYGMATMINRDYGPDSDAGFGGTIGARGFVSPGFEARAFITYESIDEIRETIYGVGMNLWFSRAFSLNAEVATSDDSNESFAVGLRFNFY
ncbi:hypothetical protein DWB84_04230 [Saccharophagus sp. K07]|nr:hypothetical protein [Saccharophagus sp. K07]